MSDLRLKGRSVALLGIEDGLYTRMMLVELRRAGVRIDLAVLVKKAGAGDPRVPKLLSAVTRLVHLKSQPGPFLVLSMFGVRFWHRLLRWVLFTRSARSRALSSVYRERPFESLLEGVETVRVPATNHVHAFLALQRSVPDLLILGGVGMVAAPLLETAGVALNAHPAPLPQCRGGGALEQTLIAGLAPSATVHVALPSADSGAIVAAEPVVLERSDSWDSVELKLSIACARGMSRVVAALLRGDALPTCENVGPLHFWRDCDAGVQRRAEAKLKARLREL